MDTKRDLAQELTHKAQHMTACIINHRKTPNIIVKIIDMFCVSNYCMSIIGNLRYYRSHCLTMFC